MMFIVYVNMRRRSWCTCFARVKFKNTILFLFKYIRVPKKSDVTDGAEDIHIEMYGVGKNEAINWKKKEKQIFLKG